MYNNVTKTSKVNSDKDFNRHGSLRRVLLPIERKDNLFGRQNEDLNNMYKKIRQEYVILAEYKMLQNQAIDGVYVIPSRQSAFLWFGVIYVRSGPFMDAIFRFNILLDKDFPDSDHPKVIFKSDILHPVIHPDTNEVHLKDAFPTWNRSEQHIWQILKYLYWIFSNVKASISHAINQEASDMYLHNRDEYVAKAKILTKISQTRIYDEPETDDKHYLIFSQCNPETHKINKLSMLSQYRNNNPKSGYSWVLPGKFKPLTRPPTPESDITES